MLVVKLDSMLSRVSIYFTHTDLCNVSFTQAKMERMASEPLQTSEKLLIQVGHYLSSKTALENTMTDILKLIQFHSF